MDRALASALNIRPHLAALYDVVDYRLNSIDLTKMMLYMIDIAPVEALPLLASQFHVSGVEGWKFASTTQMKRNLLKSAIELHRYKGTPYSIKEALSKLGYPGAYFQEGVSDFYDGTHTHDGSTTKGSEGWAKFKAFVPVDDPNNVPADVQAMITAIINEYKPVRCELISIMYIQN